MSDNIVDRLLEQLNAIDIFKDSSSSPDLSLSMTKIQNLLKRTEHILFPDIFPHPVIKCIPIRVCLNEFLFLLEKTLSNIISPNENGQNSKELSIQISESLPDVKKLLIKDAFAIYEGDPAATSVTEVMMAYPGFLAVMIYRIAHLFYINKIPYIPRMMTEHAHERTGIDIHPGATIGESFCIDHGTGIVIGETARIGNRVKIYQGVTIGAKSFESDRDGKIIRGKKRHPDIGDDCIIYAGATILGGDTAIGNGSIIGGNVWLTHSVSEGGRVYYKEK